MQPPRAVGLIVAPTATATLGAFVFSCDYNGWADVPEEEREGIDAFEASAAPSPTALPAPRTFRLPPQTLAMIPARKAA